MDCSLISHLVIVTCSVEVAEQSSLETAAVDSSQSTTQEPNQSANEATENNQSTNASSGEVQEANQIPEVNVPDQQDVGE